MTFQANPTVVTALAGGGIMAGIAGAVQYLDQRNQRRHEESLEQNGYIIAAVAGGALIGACMVGAFVVGSKKA